MDGLQVSVERLLGCLDQMFWFFHTKFGPEGKLLGLWKMFSGLDVQLLKASVGAS